MHVKGEWEGRRRDASMSKVNRKGGGGMHACQR